MQIDRNSLAAATLIDTLQRAKVGVTVKDLTGIDPGIILNHVSAEFSSRINAAIVGFSYTPPTGNVTIASDIESAVDWRSDPQLAGSIVLFINIETDKMHSLDDFNLVTTRDLSNHLLQQAADQLTLNQPQQKFWEALKKETATFPLVMIEDFVRAVDSAGDNLNSIPANMWRLGLLRDDLILDSSRDPTERIGRNRDLLVELGQLSEASRKRIGLVLARAQGDNQARMRAAYEAVKEYYRRGNIDVIQRLDVSTVEELIKAGRPMPTPPPTPPLPPETPEVGSSPGNDTGAGEGGQDRPLRGRDLEQEVARAVVSRDAEDSLHELGEAIRQRILEPQTSSEAVTIENGFNGRLIQPEIPNREHHQFFGYTCSQDRWGGILETVRFDLKDAVRRATDEDFTPYNPNDSVAATGGQCLFSLLRRFDTILDQGNTFGDIIDRLEASRHVLVGHFDLLVSFPLVLFGGYPEARQALYDYLTAYGDLLQMFRQNETLLHGRDAVATRFVATELLRLEVLHVRTPNEWKAILTPLHPFHLWRFKEVLRAIHVDDAPLSDEEANQLSNVLTELPHLLHFLVFSPDVTGGENIVLPQSGSVGLLPTYENHTNRYLGADGVTYLKELLNRWLEYAPYSRSQVRVAIVDPPDLPVTLKTIADVIKDKKGTNVVLNAYCTRNQNSIGELTWLDYEGSDHEVAEMLSSAQIVVNILNCRDKEEVSNLLQQNPVHIAYLFDQSQYNIRQAPRARQLIVSPLVITYQYEYSETFHKGTISPSSEAQDGIFADFHFLVERAIQLPAGQQLRLQYQPDIELGPYNALLRNGATRWLAIADRVLTAYSPEEAVPLGENKLGQREIAVWASSSSRSVSQFVDLLRLYNLSPDSNTIAEVLKVFAHIAAGGMLSIPAPGGNVRAREARMKGLLGTVLAARWYTREYPGALVASLDSNLARIWLRARPHSNDRADLIGLRVSSTGSLIIEPIEVKTRSDNPEVNVERDVSGRRRLTGPAIDQVIAIQEVIDSVYGRNDAQPIFTPARREVLKYQLYRECFREIHDPDWQRDWYHRLQDAFCLPDSRFNVDVAGLVIHVKLEEHGQTSIIHDDTKAVRLVSLYSNAIQQLITPCSATPQGYAETDQGVVTTTQESTTVETAAEVPVETQEQLQQAGNQQVAVSTEVDGSLEDNAPRVPQGDLVADGSGGYTPGDTEEANELARRFRQACQAFHVQIQECNSERAIAGPTVWRFYVKLARGQRLEQVRNALEDIGRDMSRSGLLISTLPNSNEVVLDIPRTTREQVLLQQVLAALQVSRSPEIMPLPIGVTPEGQHIIKDLGKMPHLLVGGTTGAGKTVFLYGLLISLLITHSDPSSLRLMLSTSKPEDFVFFEGLPHLETGSVISDAGEAVEFLQNQVRTVFDERLVELQAKRCRDIGEYNSRYPDNPLPPLVVVVDEFADLSDQLGGNRAARDAFYTNIRRIAQLGRSRGVHLVLCTQRPSANLVPTNIRNLMNVRVCLRVNDATASRMILEEAGGERLQMHGDLLFKEQAVTMRAQGYYVTGEEIDVILSPYRRD